jgi:hypothetical protein
MTGFSTWRSEGIVLQVGQDRQLDAQLAVGGVQETVTVSRAVRVVTTAVDSVLPAESIQSLPLNGRNFLELALLVPGTVPTPLFRSHQDEQRADRLRGLDGPRLATSRWTDRTTTTTWSVVP